MKNKLNWIWAGIGGGLFGSLLIYLVDGKGFVKYTLLVGILFSLFGMVTDKS